MNVPLLIPCMSDDVVQMLLLLSAGQQVRYHRGNLGADRLQSDRVQSAATCAMHLQKSGRAHLIQRRTRNRVESYDYIAVGRR